MHWPRVVLVVVIALIVVGAAAFPGIYYYRKYKDAEKKLARNPLTLEESTDALIEEVGKLIDLPQGETPTVATVSDVEKLKSQAFFAKAKNGDKVLIYNDAKKAILYDPTNKKILEVGPLLATSPTPGGPAPEASASASTETANTTPEPTKKASISPTPGKTMRVVLSNGTQVSGITSVVERQIREGSPPVSVVDKRNAAKRDYAKTLVIDIIGSNKAETAALAEKIGAEVSTLPAGEEKPDGTDILVIVGEDKK